MPCGRYRFRAPLAPAAAILGAAATVVAVLTAASPVHAEVKLRAVSALPRTVDPTRSFLDTLVKPSNQANAGKVRIEYLGGPGVASSRKAWPALKKGQFDVLHGPADYYIATVPEGYALTLSQKTPAELRENGGFALLRKIWADKAGAWLLAWGESATRHNTYLGRRPGRTPDGKLTLKGIRMRVTGTYRPLFTELRALTVGIKPIEIAPEMQRGAVDGFGWPDVGLGALGVDKLVKFRIDPGFYRTNMSVIVNLKAWNSLARDVREVLEREAIRYERDSVAYMTALRDKDEKTLKDGGMRVIRLEGEAAKHYLEAANSAVWRALEKRSKNAKALRKLAFPDFAG
jgi:TRAP-type C4-dicarboxylate transport system substrate-binding protein